MSRKSGGVGSMAALPSDRKACYAVSVTGPGITMSPSHICAPPTGLRAGFVEPGAMIEMQVPKGKDRKIELFAFLQSPGQDLPCPVFAAIIPPSQLTSIYKIGSAFPVDTSNDVTVVEITADFPGLSNHLAQQLSLPMACTAQPGQQNPPGFSVTLGRQIATGGGIKLIGGAGRPSRGRASGGGIQLVTE